MIYMYKFRTFYFLNYRSALFKRINVYLFYFYRCTREDRGI